MKPKSKILIIAGSDSSGGAGIQADIKTVTALGGYAMTAVTAITAQNTTGVKSVVPIPPKEIEKQILFTSKDIKPDAIKIGMLHSPVVINSVIKSLQKVKTKKIILDPVMVAKGGFKLINDTAIKVLKENDKVLIVEDVITTGKSSIECSELVKVNKAKVIGYACIIDRSIGKSKIKDKIVSQVQLDIPTYKKDNLPKELISIKPIKPGSRNL